MRIAPRFVAGLTLTLSLAITTPAFGQASPSPQGSSGTPSVTVGGYLQADLNTGSGGDSRFPSTNRFFLRRARLTVGGQATSSLRFRLQADFAGGLGSASAIRAQLVDGYIDWAAAPRARVRMGQFKAPFSAEFLTSSTDLLTVERSLTSDTLAANRQIGVQVDGAGADGRVSYAAGVFNGNGRNVTVNDNDEFMYAVRLTAVPWRGTTGARLLVGANAFWSADTRLAFPFDLGLDSTPLTPGADNLFTGDRRAVGVDAEFTRGIWRLDAEFLRVRFAQSNGAARPDVVSRGWQVTPSVFVHERRAQVVGRVERFRPDTAIAGNETTTWTLGLNYYMNGHRAKVMVNYLWVDTPARPDAHARLLARLQVMF